MGVNHSKSAHFIVFPLTFSPIFAGNTDRLPSGKPVNCYNYLIISYIKYYYVTDMAKL